MREDSHLWLSARLPHTTELRRAVSRMNVALTTAHDAITGRAEPQAASARLQAEG